MLRIAAHHEDKKSLAISHSLILSHAAGRRESKDVVQDKAPKRIGVVRLALSAPLTMRIKGPHAPTPHPEPRQSRESKDTVQDKAPKLIGVVQQAHHSTRAFGTTHHEVKEPDEITQDQSRT